MRGRLVLGWRVRGPVNLDEHEARRVVLLLDDVEAGDAGFLDAVAGVVERGGLEGCDAISLHVDVDVDDEHAGNLATRSRGGNDCLGYPCNGSPVVAG